MTDDVITKDMLRRALLGLDKPQDKPCVVLHPLEWERFKKAFNLTEAEMPRWFVKSTYLEVGDD